LSSAIVLYAFTFVYAIKTYSLRLKTKKIGLAAVAIGMNA